MQGKPELPHLDQHEIEFQSLHQLFAQASTFIDLKVHYLEVFKYSKNHCIKSN